MKRRNEWAAIVIIASAHCVLAILYGLLVPLGEAPDEIDHYAYVRHLMVERRLPEGPAVTQGKHPPLYYLLSAALAGRAEPGFDFVRANPDFSLASRDSSPNLLIHTALESFPYRDGPLVMHLARALSALLSTVSVWSAYRLARCAFPGQLSLAVGAAGLVAFTPGILFINGAVNNDNLAAMLSGLALLVCVQVVREGLSVRRAGLLGGLLGLGLLTKVGTLAVWPAATMALTYSVFSSARRARSGSVMRGDGLWRRTVLQWLGWNGLSFGLALGVAAIWLARNWRLYGDPLGWQLVRSTVDLRTSPLGWTDAAELVRGWFTTFWGRFGGAVHIRLPGPVYTVLGGLTMLSGLGLAQRALRAWAGSAERGLEAGRTERAIQAMMGLTVVAAVISVVRYSAIGLGTDQARLLFPALSPIAVLFFLGLAQWVPPAQRGIVAGAFTAAVFIFGLSVLFFLQGVYAPPSQVDGATLDRLDTSSAEVFDGRLALVGHAPSEPRGVAGEVLRFTLYWQAEVELQADLRSEVWVLAPDGGLVASWKRSPLGGRFSTDRWPVDTVYADGYALSLPDWLEPGGYTLVVGVREYPSESWLSHEGAEGPPQRTIAKVVVRD
jgi:hypothetical protein